MIDKLTADTQARLSYGFFVGYFTVKVMEGLKWLGDVNGIDEIALLIASFWFMRQRSQEKPNA